VSEVFKRLIRLKRERGRFFDGLSFSFFTYSTEEKDTGPPLPAEMDLDALLVGVGAIGNGVVHLLDRLPVRGKIVVVDSQEYGRENFGTCLLIGPAEIRKKKALFASEILEGKLAIKYFAEDFSKFSNRLGTEVPFPRVALNAVDNVETRREIQRELWSDMIIDGAIGDFSCQASRHAWDEAVACLICLFPEPEGEPAELVASRATGLASTRTQNAEAKVCEDDVRNAPAEKKAWLRKQIGKRICSVVQEAVAQAISEEKLRERFQPSVPFVACLSSCMMVGELIRSTLELPSPLEPRFQFDVLRGPHYGQDFPQVRRHDCICVTRRENIEIVRASQCYT
jgi:molybdopterin/thiamine biosynthesis adenylyltransferase